MTSLLALQTTPCDSIARQSFWDLMKQINDNADQIAKLGQALQAHAQPGAVATSATVGPVLTGFQQHYQAVQ